MLISFLLNVPSIPESDISTTILLSFTVYLQINQGMFSIYVTSSYLNEEIFFIKKISYFEEPNGASILPIIFICTLYGIVMKETVVIDDCCIIMEECNSEN